MDFLQRKENHRIRKNSEIKVVDDSLTRKVNGRVPWDARRAVLKPMTSPSLEHLSALFETDRTSLGLVRVHELIDFYSKMPVDELDYERSATFQRTLFGEDRTILEKIPHMFYYRFRCS